MTTKAKNYEAAWDQQHHFEGPHGWIQWKGTDVCMDVHCVCGHMSHVDADFVYQVQCPECQRVFFCNGNIQLIELEEVDESKVLVEAQY